MKEAKFTKGEWKSQGFQEESNGYINIDFPDGMIAVYGGHLPSTGKNKIKACILKAEANANLISAAPELFSALYDLVQVKEWKDKNGKDEHYSNAQPIAWENARKAINKALGK